MNPRSYRAAVMRLLDRQAPNVHIEILLLFGPQPNEFMPGDHSDGWFTWRDNVMSHMVERHGYNEQSRYHMDEVVTVIARRITKEKQRVEARL